MKRKKIYPLIIGGISLVYLGNAAYVADRQSEVKEGVAYIQRECGRERKEGLQEMEVIAEENEIFRKAMIVSGTAGKYNIEGTVKEEAKAEDTKVRERDAGEAGENEEEGKKNVIKKTETVEEPAGKNRTEEVKEKEARGEKNQTGKKTAEVSGTGKKKNGEKTNPACESSKQKSIIKKEKNEKKRKRLQTVMSQGIFLSKEDKWNLLRIVEAEATGEDLRGKMLVASVVLNRVKNDAFPSNVTEVVFQNKNGCYQFSPVKDGRLYQVKISKETRQAVKRVLAGEDYSNGALYFMARKRANAYGVQWFDSHLTPVLTHGGHEFFR